MLATHRQMLNLIKGIPGSANTRIEYAAGRIELRESYPRDPDHGVDLPSSLVKEAFSIIKALDKDGYIHIESENLGTMVAVFTLTQKGLHSGGTMIDSNKGKFFWSIVVPIVVSLLASIIYSAINE